MSVRLMTRVWELDVPHPEQSVLLALADHAHDDGSSVHPSIGYLAWKTNYSTRQVRRVMADLRDRGVLVLVRRAFGQHPSSYRLLLDRLPPKPPYRYGPDDEGDDGPSPTPDNLSGVTPASATPDTGVSQTVINRTGEPAMNRSRASARAFPKDDDWDDDDDDVQTALPLKPVDRFEIEPSPPPPPPPASTRRVCLSCHQAVGRFTGRGHAEDCPRFLLTPSEPWFDLNDEDLAAAIAAATSVEPQEAAVHA